MSVHIEVTGNAAPQGSMRHIGHGRIITDNKTLRGWRKAVIAAAQAVTGHDWEPLDGPLAVYLDVYIKRPAKTKFPGCPAGPPDLDKLQRAIGDALEQAGTITNDARIISWHAAKHWAIGTEPLTRITIHEKGK